jgi:hypothetical protein
LDDRIDNYMQEERARRDECARLITACFNGASDRLGELDAWVMFVQFARAAQPRLNGISNHQFLENEILTAYDRAPIGQRQDAAIAAGLRQEKPADTTLRYLARVLARRAAASLTTEQHRLEFGLDPWLAKIRLARDQFASLAEDHPDVEVTNPGDQAELARISSA